MENHEYSDVVGSRSAPYQNSLLHRWRNYTNYFAVAHPSLPNYLAIASGTTAGKVSDSISAGEISGIATVWVSADRSQHPVGGVRGDDARPMLRVLLGRFGAG